MSDTMGVVQKPEDVMRNTGIERPSSSEERPFSPPSSLSHQHRERSRRSSALAAGGAGLVASLVAVVVMGGLRVAAGVPTPVELFGERVLKLLPATSFVQVLSLFGSYAKTAPLGLAVLGMIVLGTLLALLSAAMVPVPLPTTRAQPAGRAWLTAAGCAVALPLIGLLGRDRANLLRSAESVGHAADGALVAG